MKVTIGRKTITSQMIFKILFPVNFVAALFLIILSIMKGQDVLTTMNLFAVGITSLSYYFSKNQIVKGKTEKT